MLILVGRYLLLVLLFTGTASLAKAQNITSADHQLQVSSKGAWDMKGVAVATFPAGAKQGGLTITFYKKPAAGAWKVLTGYSTNFFPPKATETYDTHFKSTDTPLKGEQRMVRVTGFYVTSTGMTVTFVFKDSTPTTPVP